MPTTIIAHHNVATVGVKRSHLSVTITERRLDEKRRIAIPSDMELKEGSRVILISHDKNALIVASDRKVAEEISNLLRESDLKHKLETLDEWEKLVNKAGMSGFTSKKIDRAVDKSIRRPKNF
jgi:bifunctional DNA-binding transcriptional regulator/antitoxin component of YhaV-PrlF toxin-antitoxin module